MHNGIEHSIMFAAETSVLCQRSLVRLLAIILRIELFAIELANKVAHTLSSSISLENSPFDLMYLQIYKSRVSLFHIITYEEFVIPDKQWNSIEKNINGYQNVHMITNILKYTTSITRGITKKSTTAN